MTKYDKSTRDAILKMFQAEQEKVQIRANSYQRASGRGHFRYNEMGGKLFEEQGQGADMFACAAIEMTRAIDTIGVDTRDHLADAGDPSVLFTEYNSLATYLQENFYEVYRKGAAAGQTPVQIVLAMLGAIKEGEEPTPPQDLRGVFPKIRGPRTPKNKNP